MRIIVLFSLYGFLALAVQTCLLYWTGVQRILPDFLLILVVNLGLKHHSISAAIMAFALGYMTDAFSGARIGLNTFLVTVVFLACYETSRHLWVNNDLVGTIAVFFAVVFKDLATFLVTDGPKNLSDNLGAVLLQVITQALITACLTPVVFELLRRGATAFRLPKTEESD